jgi:hypothetical protein
MSKQFKKLLIKHGQMYMGNSFCFAAGLYVTFYSKEVLLDNMVHKGHHFILALRELFVGFASYQHDYLDDQVHVLHKILTSKRKEKVGRLLIDAVVVCKRIILRRFP